MVIMRMGIDVQISKFVNSILYGSRMAANPRACRKVTACVTFIRRFAVISYPDCLYEKIKE
jgi:hypothetical protein